MKGSRVMEDRVSETPAIDALSIAVLNAWKRFGKLAGDDPTHRERTMARVAAEVMWASVVIAKLEPKETPQ